MNQYDRAIDGTPAQVEYLDADFRIVSPGDYVICAATGQHIPLEELRYWSPDRQEAYASADASLQRMLDLKGNSK